MDGDGRALITVMGIAPASRARKSVHLVSKGLLLILAKVLLNLAALQMLPGTPIITTTTTKTTTAPCPARRVALPPLPRSPRSGACQTMTTSGTCSSPWSSSPSVHGWHTRNSPSPGRCSAPPRLRSRVRSGHIQIGQQGGPVMDHIHSSKSRRHSARRNDSRRRRPMTRSRPQRPHGCGRRSGSSWRRGAG